MSCVKSSFFLFMFYMQNIAPYGVKQEIWLFITSDFLMNRYCVSCFLYFHIASLNVTINLHKDKHHTQQVLPEDFFPLLSFIHFCYFSDSKAFLCLQAVLVSTDVDPILFVLDFYMKYRVEVVPLRTYIVFFVIVW